MHIDWDNVEELTDFSPVPDGEYLCQLAEIEEASCRTGEMWKLTFKVDEGQYKGKKIFDNMVFSVLPRVKLICSRLGFETLGDCDLVPNDILNCKCYITVFLDSYKKDNGEEIIKNSVTYAGYREYEMDDGKNKENNSDIPF